ncbi:MAG TPA: DUF1810 domain-containing protein [Rhizomicrobium sp.]|jgi:uncharacterized protein (DUF1810 family)
MTATDRLAHFVEAQDPVIGRALAELRAGRKRSHWMWFVFPQIAGLGRSDMAQRYAIASLDEARAYLAHPVLGARLEACTRAALSVEDRSVHDIFGFPDDLKFRSSMTLFARAAPDNPLFHDALKKYFGGEEDKATRDRLA